MSAAPFGFTHIFVRSLGSRSRPRVFDMPDYNSFEKNRSIGMSILHFQVRPYGRGGKMKTISRGGGKAARTLLSCGVASGPVFLLIFVIQILIHPEFHFTHSEPSLLSIGSLGWIQIANCVIGGLLVIAGSLGMRVVLRSSKGGGWGPLLLAIFGGGTVGVGVFVADAAGSATSRTFHGTMHLVFGGVSFGCLMFACFVFARAFTSLGQKPWAIFSAVTGLLFLAGFFSAANASQGARSIQLFLNLIFVLAWVWISLISRRLLGIVSAWETTQSLN